MNQWEFKKDGFLFRKRHEKIAFLCIELNRLKQCLEYAQKNNVKYFDISYFHEYKSNDINFLLEHKDTLEGLYLNGDFFELSPLRQLNNLKYLVFWDFEQQPIDLFNFPKLEFLSIKWYPKIFNLEKCMYLRELGLMKYNPKNKDFSQLLNLHNLNSLGINQSNITTFSGLEHLDQLEYLSLRRCPKLEKFQYFENLRKLKSLVLDKCKRVEGLSQIQHLKQLEVLRLDDCPDISDIKFLTELKHLKKLYIMKTKVLDGDMSLLFKLKPFEELAYTNYKHYTHSNWDIMNSEE